MSGSNRPPPLALISLSKIRRNPANPRGSHWREDDPQFESLRSSIRQFGILVPLVVTPRNGDFLLLDGERRLEATLSLRDIEEVPAYILEGDLNEPQVQSIMFHIHMNRVQWNAAQQCRASESLYSALVKKHEGGRPAILKDFMATTGMDSRTARNRLQFLRWPEKIRSKVYDEKQDAYWYVVEIEDKIVEPAERNYPEFFEKVSVDDVRKFLFDKYEAGLVTAAVEVREAKIVANSKFTDSQARERVVNILLDLARQRDYSFHDAREEFLSAFPEVSEPALPSPTATLNSIRKLSSVLLAYEGSIILDGHSRGQRKVDPEELKDALRVLQQAADHLLQDLSEG